MSLAQLSIDDGSHNMDGLRLYDQDGTEQVEAFIGRKVMDVWAESVERRGGRQSLFRGQYNALGKLNLAAIERIVSAKYQRGATFNRQHPFVEVLVSDITESGEVVNTPPAKAGGFGLRLEAGLIDPPGRLVKPP
jgi:hypothetical protein